MSRLSWPALQGLGLVATVALVGGLWLRPETTLSVLWYGAVPVLPAVFLVAPALWRNTCPLATLNMLAGRRVGARTLSPRGSWWAGGAGIALLGVMVPARHLVFNLDGPVLAGTIVAVGVLALGLGLLFDQKAGFCNGICPVLPVERLYAQRPFVGFSNARCASCTLCTARACLDLSPRRSASRSLDPTGDRPWLLTPFGAFAAAFPGFVLGYYRTTDVGWAGAAEVYAAVFLWAALSYLVVATVVVVGRTSASSVLPALAASAAALYYWFGAPGVAEAWGWGPAAVLAIRMGALVLIGGWWLRILLSSGSRRAPAAAQVRTERSTGLGAVGAPGGGR